MNGLKTFWKKNQTAIIAGLVLFFVFGFAKKLMQSIGLAKSDEEIAKEKEDIEAQENFIKDALAQSKQTKSDYEWGVIADQIYQDLRYSALDDDKDDAGYQVCRVKNQADLAVLVKKFGKRQEYHFGFPAGDKKDLHGFINSNLTDAAINTINNNYSRKKISFRF